VKQKSTAVFRAGLRRMSQAALVAVALSLSAGCFLSGAPTGQQQEGAVPTAGVDRALAALIHQAAKSTASLHSAHLVLATTGKIDGLAHISSADLDVRVGPLGAAGKVAYDGQINVPFVLMDNAAFVRLFDEWTNIGSVEDLFAPGLIDPSAGVAKILESVVDPQAGGSETIDGTVTTKVTGSVPVEAAKIMLPQANGPKKIAVWIKPDGDHQVVRSLVEVSPGSTVQNTLSQWNVPVTISKQP
jgi:lipoprotein LprG